jgi:MobA/MobL family
MASYHLSAGVIARTAGYSSVAAAAYRARCALTDERTGTLHDYSRKSGELLWQGIYAPKDAPEWARERVQLWNHVEAFERRRDAQLARSFDIALPHELTLEQNRYALQDWVRENFTRKGLIADAVIHAPGRDGDQRNIHAHVMVVLRKLDGNEFAAKKERSETLADRKAELEGLRESWERIGNRHLERYGHAPTLDRRTLLAQGIDREPTVHLGKHATAIERDGKPTQLGDANRAIVAGQVIDLAAMRQARDGSPAAEHSSSLGRPAAANQNTRTTMTLEGIAREPWQAVDQPLPKDAGRTFLATVAFVADQCAKWAFAESRVSQVMEPELVGYCRARHADAGARRDEARRRLGDLAPDEIATVSPFLHPKQMEDRVLSGLYGPGRQGAAAEPHGSVSAEAIQQNRWNAVMLDLPQNASWELLARVDGLALALNEEAWMRRDSAYTREEAALWNDVGWAARQCWKDLGFELERAARAMTPDERAARGIADPDQPWIGSWAPEPRDRSPEPRRGIVVPLGRDDGAREAGDGRHDGARAPEEAGGRFFGSVGGAIGRFVNFLSNLFSPPPPMTRDQVERAQQSAAEERAEAARTAEQEAYRDRLLDQIARDNAQRERDEQQARDDPNSRDDWGRDRER